MSKCSRYERGGVGRGEMCTVSKIEIGLSLYWTTAGRRPPPHDTTYMKH